MSVDKFSKALDPGKLDEFMDEVKEQLKTISTHDNELGDSYSFL